MSGITATWFTNTQAGAGLVQQWAGPSVLGHVHEAPGKRKEQMS